MSVLLAACVSGAFLVFAWLAAKRDLTASAAQAQSPSLDELRNLRETVEGLIVVLEHKAAEIEDRMEVLFDRLAEFERNRPVVPPGRSDGSAEPEQSHGTLNERDAEPSVLGRALELLAQGNDPSTVAQMTGLTVAEIETAARMKDLRSGRR